ncbi:LemA family protein [Rariglobus hedericola]|uniref:LemA family protein n=1 Tax=Rariglobus hedericola TaxID=2597822 RepID=UPI001396AF21|nr:LemA family protein [Rariglobus hedericola]
MSSGGRQTPSSAEPPLNPRLPRLPLSIAISVIGGIFAIGLLTLIIFSASIIGTYNTQKSNGLLIEAKEDANRVSLSTLKSKFNELGQITDAQFDQLTKLFVNYAEARTSDNAGAVLNFVKETVPNVDQSTFKELMQIVSSTRDSFAERQRELVDLVRVYNTPLETFPSNFVLKFFGFEKKKALIVITSDTKRAFETGIDEPATLFQKNPTPIGPVEKK